MYQQGTVDNIHLLHANKMAETLMRLQQQGQDYPLQSSVGNDRRATDEVLRNQYQDHHSSSSAVNFTASHHQQSTSTGNSTANAVGDSDCVSSSSLFVVIPRSEYDSMKQELSTLKHSLNELKSSVNYEIHQLKAESKTLKQRIDCCTCVSNMRTNKDITAGRKSATWSSENAWDGRTYATNQQHSVNMCSPSTSSPENLERSSTVTTFTTLGSYNGSSCVGSSLPPMTCGLFGSPEHGNGSDSERGKVVQLLPNYDVWVNKLNLQITVNEAPTRKEGAALYLLRRIIPLVFTWDELACSRGQGLNCKTTDDVFGRAPLDPTKVMACKAFMRKFCADIGCGEPTERSVNQTFSHQVNYARRRIKTAGQPCVQRSAKKLRRSQMQVSQQQADTGIDSTSSLHNGPIQPKNERYMQI